MNSTDRLKIETPEQISLELPLAGIGSRFLALAVDSIIQLLVAILTLLVLFVFTSAGKFFANIGVAILVIIYFFLYWGYFAFFEILWNGQTPGKRVAKIRVIKESGRPITPVEAITRNLMRAVDIVGLYAVGLVCMLLNSQNKRLGDYVAGTVVVHDESIEMISPVWNAGDLSSINLQTEKISPDELVLIEKYLNRRHELDPQVKRKTARQIVSMIKTRTGIEPMTGQSDESFLETLARAVRDNARYRR